MTLYAYPLRQLKTFKTGIISKTEAEFKITDDCSQPGWVNINANPQRALKDFWVWRSVGHCFIVHFRLRNLEIKNIFLHCSSLTMSSVFEKFPLVTDLKFERCIIKYKNRECPPNPTLTVVEHTGPWMPKIQCLKGWEEKRKWDNLRIWHYLYLPDCSN